MSLESFDYRGYRCEIFPDYIIFIPSQDNPIGEYLPDLKIPSSEDDLDMRKKLAQKIIDKYCWEFFGEFRGHKLSTRFSLNHDTSLTGDGVWIAQFLKCEKKNDTGEIISPKESEIIIGWSSLISTLNAAITFIRG